MCWTSTQTRHSWRASGRCTSWCSGGMARWCGLSRRCSRCVYRRPLVRGALLGGTWEGTRGGSLQAHAPPCDPPLPDSRLYSTRACRRGWAARCCACIRWAQATTCRGTCAGGSVATHTSPRHPCDVAPRCCCTTDPTGAVLTCITLQPADIAAKIAEAAPVQMDCWRPPPSPASSCTSSHRTLLAHGRL